MSGKVGSFPRAIVSVVKVALLCGLLIFVSACASKETGSGESGEGSETASAPATGANKRELVYGITVTLPEGWVIASSADQGVAEDAEVLNHVKRGERVGILSIYRANQDGSDATGGISLFIVNAKKDFMPEEEAAKLTAEATAHLSEVIIKKDRELAAEKKAKSPILEWRLTRETVNGRLALLHTGLAEGPAGKVNLLNADIYLPNGVGVAVKSAGNAEPGTATVLRNFLNSIQVKK